VAALLIKIVVSAVAMGILIRLMGPPASSSFLLMAAVGMLGRMSGLSANGIILLSLGAFGVMEAIQRALASKPEEEGPVMPEVTGGPVITSPFGKIDPNKGLQDKIDHFCVHKLGVAKPLEELHVQLGMPENISPLDILHQKQMFALAAPAFVALFFAAMGVPVFLAIFVIPVGFILPEQRLRGQVANRQKEIMRNFSTMVDLAALTIESGLDYMQAFEKIIKVARKKTELEKEMERMLSEVSLGYTRREALTRFAERTGLQEIRSFVGLIIQSDELGTSLVDLLRNYGADLRYRRIQNAEKAAAQASTKMLIPMFIFIFPVVFIAMLGPMLMQLVTGSTPF
jgi:tight adherence protein C